MLLALLYQQTSLDKMLFNLLIMGGKMHLYLSLIHQEALSPIQLISAVAVMTLVME